MGIVHGQHLHFRLRIRVAFLRIELANPIEIALGRVEMIPLGEPDARIDRLQRDGARASKGDGLVMHDGFAVVRARGIVVADRVEVVG